MTSYIFFVECKFKARISAYSLYTIVSGVLLYHVGVMSDSTLIIIFPLFVSYTITSYIFFVECKFKAKIKAYSLHHSKWCTELYNVGVMSNSTLIIIFPCVIIYYHIYYHIIYFFRRV